MEYRPTDEFSRRTIRCIGIAIATTLTLTVVIDNVTGGLIPNTCGRTPDDFVDIGWSFQQCIYQCSIDASCVAVSFQGEMMLCKLHFQDNPLSNCSGYIYSSKTQGWTQKPYTSEFAQLYDCELSGHCFAGLRCPPLTDPLYGRLLGNRFSEGHKVIVVCNPGYIISGSKQRTCSSGSWTGIQTTCIEDPDCHKYLISGPNGVADNQLTESINWCLVSGHVECLPGYTSAIYARLNSTGYFTGAWVAGDYSRLAYLQVDFLTRRVITAIVLTGRDNLDQYVTEFKVLVSNDCSQFHTIKAMDGSDKLFVGTTGWSTVVTRPLPVRLPVRCVRLQPTDWIGHPSLRFDIEGC